MSGEFLSLSQLSPEPQIANTDRELLPIVLIANTEPEVLNTAVTGVFSESYLANAEHNQATQIYNKELEKSDPKTVSPELRFAAEKLKKKEKHHQQKTFINEFKDILDQFKVEYDEKYIFNLIMRAIIFTKIFWRF